MCTVTIIPKGKNNFVLTTNRDEAPERATVPPDFYTIDDTTMLFPKDARAGGTWVGISEKQRVVCLLNGAFWQHERQPRYRMSRGLVVTDFLIAKSMEHTIELYDFEGIEPFTMLIVDWNYPLSIYELVWDGREPCLKKLPLEPKIWSSSSLYSEGMKQQRNLWFTVFKLNNKLNANTLMHFHKTAGHENKNYGVVMDRGFVKTTSITQIEKSGRLVEMRYHNLQDKSISTIKLPFK